MIGLGVNMKLVEVCAEALNILTTELSGGKVEASTFPDAFKAFERYKNSGSSASIIKDRLGLDENRLRDFMAALRKLKDYLQVTGDSAQSRRNIQIASLRLMDWFFDIAKTFQSIAPLATKVSEDLERNRGYKQVRAAELVIRSLISEQYGSQEKLIRFIRECFRKDPDAVKKIERNAEPDDILSGTEFSQLVCLFLKPDDFSKHYLPIYDAAPFLGYLRDKRDTLILFLDDIRRIRNRIAHHRPLTSAQVELLDIYYDEIIGPIQSAHDEGKVKVDPDRHLEIGEAELSAFANDLHEDLGEIKESISRMSEDVSVIRADVGWLRKHSKWITGGVVALVLLSILSTSLIERTRQVTLDVKKDTTDIKSDTTEIKTGLQNVDGKLSNVKQETSEDPRKELVNLGYQWTLEGFDRALEATDLRAVSLFVTGGWNPKSDFSANPDELSAIARMIWSNKEGAASVIDVLITSKAITPQDRFKMSVYRSIAEKHTLQKSLLAIAIYGNNTGVIEYLVRKGYADVNKPLDDSGYPLVFAAGELTIKQETVETLIKLGADIGVDGFKAYQVVSSLMDRCKNVDPFISGCGADRAVPRNQRIKELLKPPTQVQKELESVQRQAVDSKTTNCISRVSGNLPFSERTLDEAARFDMFSRDTYTPEDSVKAELQIRIKTSQRVSRTDYENIVKKTCSR